ncbi:MAG: DUF2157 domain-containing protein [Kiritimatiellae bacterium]|nr:DUF2157 domain-containing protein [Kiritimatiellia bacterium]
MTSKQEWLRREIDAWERESLITEQVASTLRGRYPQEGGSRRAAMIGLAALGALLAGGGIILLLAHNWADLPRGLRVAFALTPLISAQLLALFGALAERSGAGWREGVGVFWTLSIGAAIAVVSQIYHISGSFDAFMLTWLILALPVIYLMRSSLVAVLFTIGALAWACPLYDTWPRVLGYWPLTLAVVPMLIQRSRRNVFTPGLALLRWTLTLSLFIGIGITMERLLPGLWIVVYAALCSVLFLTDLYFLRNAPSLWHRPMRIAGFVGCIVLSLILTYRWGWEDIGWRHWHHGYSAIEQIIDIAIALMLMGVAVVFGVLTRKQWRVADLFPACFFLLAIVAYALASYFDHRQFVQLLYNAFVFVFGVVLLASGARDQSLGRVNIGMLLLATVIVLRFFDADLSIVLRAVVFIVLGAAFLSVNTVFSQKFRRAL